MQKKHEIELLRNVIKQMLTPVKNIPLNLVVEAISEKRIIPIDCKKDKNIIKNIKKAILECSINLVKNPIEKETRPNEVGNKIEIYIKEALINNGFKIGNLCSSSGIKKTTGYPDILIKDIESNKNIYVECKTFNSCKPTNTTLRSFFLSPSPEFKVSEDGIHLIISLGMKKNENGYIAKTYKVIDAYNLLCDVKYEFNSDNKRMYHSGLAILEGDLS